MYKYGEPINIGNSTSKTLIPRNLTYRNNISNISQTTIIGANTTVVSQSSANFNTASIVDLNVSNINAIINALSSNIVVGSPIAFSVLKSEYETNNFTLYPVFFSQDILIKNKNVKIETDNLQIKDNVFIINSETTDAIVNNNTSNNVISGFIFPIADQNISTGFYAGLLYVPNNKIDKLNPNSTIYKWISTNFKYFTNTNKGFFKLKYLPQTLNFNVSTMDENYLDLVNNNLNLANLQISALALGDGEIVSMINNISFKLSDGINLNELINININSLSLKNNLSLNFIDNFVIKDKDGNQFISLDGMNNIVNFYQNLLLNNNEFYINFNSLLHFYSNNKTLMLFNSLLDKLEIFTTTFINDIKILNSIELNNIPLKFINSLDIIGNNSVFINLNAVSNSINLLKPTFVDTINFTNIMRLTNNIPIRFTNNLNIQDSNSVNYILFANNAPRINFLVPTVATNFSINTTFNLLNDIPIIVSNQFIVQNAGSRYITFDSLNNNFYNNLFFTKTNPMIKFNYGQTLSIRDNNSITKINIDSGLNIYGPNNGFQDISNTIVNSSITMYNTEAKDYNLTFTPFSKVFILSGITQINAKITFSFSGVAFQNLMSGKIIGTTRALNTNSICMYDINVWTYINGSNEFDIAYNSLLPVNNNNIGDWNIINMYLTDPNFDNTYQLNIVCQGSAIDRVLWSFKLDSLAI